MRKFSLYNFLSLLVLTSCQNQEPDLIIEDFESASFANWTVQGDAFGETHLPKEASRESNL